MARRLTPQTVLFLRAGNVRVTEAPGWLTLLWFCGSYTLHEVSAVYLEREATAWAKWLMTAGKG